MMHKSKFLLITLFLILTGTTIFVTTRLITNKETEEILPAVEGAGNIKMSIPGIIKGNNIETFDAASALLWDKDNQIILFEQNGFDRRPIASITKLMTAMVALDHGIDWNREVIILPADQAIGGKLLLHPGEHVTMRDLFAASLVGSANNATRAYVRELGIPHEEFIRKMNRKAIELKLEQTEFADVTGLSDDNISTAYEVALMAAAAFEKYPEIARLTAQEEYSFTVGGTGREHTIKNTNQLLAEGGSQVSGSKTGFLYSAQYCLVTQGLDKHRNRVSVILGSDNRQGHFIEAQRLLELPVP